MSDPLQSLDVWGAVLVTAAHDRRQIYQRKWIVRTDWP